MDDDGGSSVGPAPVVPLLRGTGARWTAVALTVGVLTPVLAVVIARAGRDWLPVQDFAVIDLRVRDVWSSDVPLVGPYSRLRWNHPGPWIYWFTAPLSLLSGRAAWATIVGFASIQAVAVVWLARTCWRHGGLAMTAFGLSVVGLFFATVGPQIVLEPWNPHVAVPFFVLLVFQLWFLACGDLRQLPGAAVVATLVVQAHVGYVPIVLVGAAVAAVFVLRDARARRIDTSRWRTTAALALGLTLLLWLPPLVEEIRRAPRGSLVLTVRSFLSGAPGHAPAGLRAGFEAFGASFTIPPPWLAGGVGADPITGAVLPTPIGWWLVPIILGTMGALAVRRTRDRSDARLLVLSAALVVTGVAAIAGIRGELRPYMFLWAAPAAILFLTAVLRALARWAGLFERPWAVVALTAVLAVAAVVPSVGLARVVLVESDRPDPRSADAAAVLAALRPPGEPTIIRFAGSAIDGLQGALFNELDRRGAPVRVDSGSGFQWGYGRELAIADAHEVWYVVEEGPYASLLTAMPGARTVASTTPLPEAEEQELVGLERKLAAGLIAAGRPELVSSLSSDLVAFVIADVPGIDRAAAERIAALNQQVRSAGRCRCAVIAFPPAAAPVEGDDALELPQNWDTGSGAR